MKNENIDVYKFGGSSLADSDCLRDVCDLIHQNASDNIIIVVSAMSGVTNQLLAITQEKNDRNWDGVIDHFKKTLKEINIDSEKKTKLMANFSKAFCNNCSVSVSIEEVASSKIKIFGLRT